MKKIITQEEKDRKNKRNQIIVGVTLVSLIILSSLGYAIMSRSEDTTILKEKYAGLTFQNINGYWTTFVAQKQLYFNKLPEEVLNVSIEGQYSATDYAGQTIYLVNSNPATVTLTDFLSTLALRIQEACLEGQECINSELPVKTCEDNMFVFKESNETKVYKTQNCVFIEGNHYDAVDRLIYKIYGIA